MKFRVIFVLTFCLISGEILACNTNVNHGRRKRSAESGLNIKLVDVSFKVYFFLKICKKF